MQLNFHVPRSDDSTWSSLFATMEGLSAEADMEDYSLSQTTLEQVSSFLLSSLSLSSIILIKFIPSIHSYGNAFLRETSTRAESFLG